MAYTLAHSSKLSDWLDKKAYEEYLKSPERAEVFARYGIEKKKNVSQKEVFLSSLPKENRVHGDTVYIPPCLTVTRGLVRYCAGGFVNTVGLKYSYRGEIKEFSRSSQKRLRDAVDGYDFRPTFFFTLTYPPAVCPDDMTVAFFQLRDFCRTVDRFAANDKPPIWIWKKEFQKNGNVHFHVVTNACFDVSGKETPFIKFPKGYNRKYKKRYAEELALDKRKLLTKVVISRLQDVWAHVIDDDCDNRNSMDVSAVLSDNAVGTYLAKYVSKKDGSSVECPQDIEKCGRWWGVFNRKHYVFICSRQFDLTDGLAEYNKNKFPSGRRFLHVAVQELLHDMLDSDKYVKLWRAHQKAHGYVKNEWFIPKDLLKKRWLEQKLLDILPYYDIFVDRVFFDSSAENERDYRTHIRSDGGETGKHLGQP